MSDWSVIESDLDVKSISSNLSESGATTQPHDDFVDVGITPSWLVESVMDPHEDDLVYSSDTFSWISSQNSESEHEDFVNDENGSMLLEQQRIDIGNIRHKFKQRSSQPVVALVNGKSVLKLRRPKPRSKRDYIRRRRYLSRLASIAETKRTQKQREKEEEEQYKAAESKTTGGSVLRISQRRSPSSLSSSMNGTSTSMSEIDESLRMLLLDKTKTTNQYLIDLCNHIATFGRVKTLDGIDINLYESSFVSERLREMIFSRLFGEECFTEWNARKNWVDLNKKARMLMLILFNSSEEIHMTFAIHHSVPMDLLLRVCDMRSFELLSQDEWVRVATFGSYCKEARSKQEEEKDRERDVILLTEIMEQSAFVKLPFLTLESVRQMAGRLKLSVTEEDIQSTFSSSVCWSI